MKFAICTKNMELLKLNSKELPFIKVRCLINVNVSLEANLEG